MPQQGDVETILSEVELMASAAAARGIHLRVAGHRFGDGWLYVVVEPTAGGQRASQYAHFMTEIERVLQRRGFDQVLVVPAVPEHQGLVDVPPAA